MFTAVIDGGISSVGDVGQQHRVQDPELDAQLLVGDRSTSRSRGRAPSISGIALVALRVRTLVCHQDDDRPFILGQREQGLDDRLDPVFEVVICALVELRGRPLRGLLVGQHATVGVEDVGGVGEQQVREDELGSRLVTGLIQCLEGEPAPVDLPLSSWLEGPEALDDLRGERAVEQRGGEVTRVRTASD